MKAAAAKAKQADGAAEVTVEVKAEESAAASATATSATVKTAAESGEAKVEEAEGERVLLGAALDDGLASSLPNFMDLDRVDSALIRHSDQTSDERMAHDIPNMFARLLVRDGWVVEPRMLAKGGFGVVIALQRPGDDRRYVCKILQHADDTRSFYPHTFHGIMREFQLYLLLSRLGIGPRVPTDFAPFLLVHDRDRETTMCALIMERADGSLRDYAKVMRERPLAAENIAQLNQQFMGLLGRMTAIDLLCTDIKAVNFLVDWTLRSGRADSVRLMYTDFGTNFCTTEKLPYALDSAPVVLLICLGMALGLFYTSRLHMLEDQMCELTRQLLDADSPVSTFLGRASDASFAPFRVILGYVDHYIKRLGLHIAADAPAREKIYHLLHEYWKGHARRKACTLPSKAASAYAAATKRGVRFLSVPTGDGGRYWVPMA